MTTTDQLAAIQARADAATDGPWEVEQRTDDEMVYEGEDCSMCAVGKPLGSSEDYPAEFGHEAYSMHRHEAEPHHINGPASGITGNYDYEEGGILRGADVEFIAHARTDVPALIAIVREQQARIERGLAACERVISNADGHKPPGPPHPTREQATAARIRAAITATEGA